MINIEKPKGIECVYTSEDGRISQFVIEPLEKGYGTTLGNSLRRVLLSSLPGAAATAITIDGIRHEFSTIPGVVEDVTEIVLNLKGVNFRLHAESAEVVINHTGSGIITAGDIVCSSDVEVLNPDHHIATLNDDAKLFIRIDVKNGTGWRVADKNKTANQASGVIPIDSIFSPVEKVNFRVENTLVGNSTDYDKLTLDIETNGAITPEEALSLSAKILTDQLSIFVNLTETQGFITQSVESDDESAKQKLLETSIEDLDLSVRSYNCLKRANVNTVGHLVSMTADEMMKVRNLGKKSLEEIQNKVAELGLEFKGDVDESNA
jgi:DNA-directed RNA polymerase subunit alpha